ncbi:MAG: TraR/DksA C4-type zinc finger protein [Gaiellaceae bacterium]|jgi:RNA polymerase-binding transcription factor DksA
MKASELEGYRKSLLGEKERLSAALEYLHAENPGAEEEQALELSSLEEHLAEAGSVTLEREIDYSLEEVVHERLAAISQAFERIEQGNYGLCVSCSAPIAAERLVALPWTSLCIDCKRREERG